MINYIQIINNYEELYRIWEKCFMWRAVQATASKDDPCAGGSLKRPLAQMAFVLAGYLSNREQRWHLCWPSFKWPASTNGSVLAAWLPASTTGHLYWLKVAGGCRARHQKQVLAARTNRFWPSDMPYFSPTPSTYGHYYDGKIVIVSNYLDSWCISTASDHRSRFIESPEPPHCWRSGKWVQSSYLLESGSELLRAFVLVNDVHQDIYSNVHRHMYSNRTDLDPEDHSLDNFVNGSCVLVDVCRTWKAANHNGWRRMTGVWSIAVTPQNRNNILECHHTTTSHYRHTHKKKTATKR
jgi:hypothetical protein